MRPNTGSAYSERTCTSCDRSNAEISPERRIRELWNRPRVSMTSCCLDTASTPPYYKYRSDLMRRRFSVYVCVYTAWTAGGERRDPNDEDDAFWRILRMSLFIQLPLLIIGDPMSVASAKRRLRWGNAAISISLQFLLAGVKGGNEYIRI